MIAWSMANNACEARGGGTKQNGPSATGRSKGSQAQHLAHFALVEHFAHVAQTEIALMNIYFPNILYPYTYAARHLALRI